MPYEKEYRFAARGQHVAMVFILLWLCGGCAMWSNVQSPQPEPPSTSSQLPEAVQTADYIIVVAQPEDTLPSLAARFLGDAGFYWVIADFNDISQVTPGQEVVIPLKSYNPVGVYPQGYQTVPILVYHRFGSRKERMVVSPQTFEHQMEYLKTHDYRVIRLQDLLAFLHGQRAVPRRAVVITIDDGYKSAYTTAYPVLKRYGFPATLFAHTDFIGTRNGLSWEEMQEMLTSGLIDIQPHSKTHSNLVRRKAGERNATYVRRVEEEIKISTRKLQQHLQTPLLAFGYPYGETNDYVITRLQAEGYQMGVTVKRGGNAFFTDPFMLRRSMIYGEYTLDDFVRQLRTFQEERLP